MYLVRSGAIVGFESLVTRLGGNPIQLLHDTGLTPSNFRNPNTYISYNKMAELLERCARACKCPLFGLMLAEQHGLEVLGDLPVSIAAESSLGEALKKFDQYLYLHASGVHVAATPIGENVKLTVSFSISTPLGLEQITQMSIGHMAILVTSLVNVDRYSIRMYLRQSRPNTGKISNLNFLNKLKFDERFDGLLIPSDMLSRKVFAGERALQNHFQQYLQHLHRLYPDNLEDKVKDIIGRLLPSGDCCIENVSSNLDMHPRILQKELQSLGTTYSALLRETRKTIAEQHLSTGIISITDLALNLGYSEVSVFSRHFKSWFGVSPKQWRARSQPG